MLDRTRMTPQFVSTTRMNATEMVLAGQDVGNVLAEYHTRLDVLDDFLKTASSSHYYSYYFGISLSDGGYARDGVGVYGSLYQPNELISVEIDGNKYVFVTSNGNDAIYCMNASDLNHQRGTQMQLVYLFNSANNPTIGSALDGPTALAYANIGSKHYLFVTTMVSDGLMIIDITDPRNMDMVKYLDDSNTLYDKLGNPRGVTTHKIGSSWYCVVASYSDPGYGGNGIMILNVDDPAVPYKITSLTDSLNGFNCLSNPWGVDMLDIDGVPFLFVAGYSDDCVQIIDMSIPSTPVAAFGFTRLLQPFAYLDGVKRVKAFSVGARSYVMASGVSDYTTVVLDVTDPYAPTVATSMSQTVSKSKSGRQFLGVGSDASHQGGIRTYKTLDALGRVCTFGVMVGHWSYGSLQLVDLSDPSDPYPVAWIQGQTSSSGNYYVMYYYPWDVEVVESNGNHFALVSVYSSYESTSYPNGVQVVKLDTGY